VVNRSGRLDDGVAPSPGSPSIERGYDVGTTQVTELTIFEVAGGQHRLELRTTSVNGDEFVVEVEGPAEVVDADAEYLGLQYGVTPQRERQLA